MLGFTIVVVIIVMLFGIMVIAWYNSLIARKNQVRNAFAGTEALLKKRYDLVPNLVATVKTYMKHEQKLLTEITKLRAQVGSPQISDEEKLEVHRKMSGLLRRLLVVVEQYPDLKSNQNFLHLQASLNEIEEQISAARRAYNASVTDYNNAIEMFPTNILASLMQYQRKPLFEISEEERQNVDVGKLFS